jgi:hypothetical protein
VPLTCPVERSDTDSHGHSVDQREVDDLHERWCARVQSQPSRLGCRPPRCTMISAESAPNSPPTRRPDTAGTGREGRTRCITPRWTMTLLPSAGCSPRAPTQRPRPAGLYPFALRAHEGALAAAEILPPPEPRSMPPTATGTLTPAHGRIPQPRMRRADPAATPPRSQPVAPEQPRAHAGQHRRLIGNYDAPSCSLTSPTPTPTRKPNPQVLTIVPSRQDLASVGRTVRECLPAHAVSFAKP